MRRNKYNSRKIFSELPRHVRADHVFRVKHEIMRTRDDYGPYFSSVHPLENDVGENTWMDIVFLSKKDKFNYWNVTIDTTYAHVFEVISEMSRKMVENVISRDQYLESMDLYLDKGKLFFRDQPPLPQFEGRTYDEQVSLFKEEMFRSPPKVYEKFEILKDYSYGTGLHVVVDAPFLTKEKIEEAIFKFYDIGEKNWISDVASVVPSLV